MRRGDWVFMECWRLCMWMLNDMTEDEYCSYLKSDGMTVLIHVTAEGKGNKNNQS